MRVGGTMSEEERERLKAKELRKNPGGALTTLGLKPIQEHQVVDV
jgi:hypothetical protein